MSAVAEGVLLAATFACLLANACEVVAKAAGARFVTENAAEVGVDRKWIPGLAVLEGAGAAGLLLGLLGLPRLGAAAALGLVLFFAGAVAAHARARVFHNLAFPAAFLFLAVAALGHFLGAA
nr:DoxX family protein [Streptomyces sulphureus]